MYETWLESVPGALPAVLVTGKFSGSSMNTAAAAIERMIVDTAAQIAVIPAVLAPILSFISEAVPDANVMNTTGMAMKTPRLMR